MFLFFFNDTATTEIYTLSLHDALPISFNIGNNALNGVHANTSMASVLTVNGNSYAGTASTIAAAGITWGWGVLVSDWNAAEGLQTFEADDNATVNALAATSTVGASMLTEWGDAVNGYWMSGGLNGSALFGVQLWNFTVAPTPEEIKAALAWSVYEWGVKGNKAAYPAWAARA